MLVNQLKLNWKLSLSIAWSLFWRELVIGVIPMGLLKYFAKSAGVFLALLLSIGQIALGIIVLAVAIWWLFERDKRLGRLSSSPPSNGSPGSTTTGHWNPSAMLHDSPDA